MSGSNQPRQLSNPSHCDGDRVSGGGELVAPAGDTGVAMRGGALRVGGYVCGVLVSLGTATILVRHLGIPRFGRYVTITSLIALVGGMTEAGIIVYGIREFVARGEPDRRVLMGNLLGVRLALTLVGVIIAACFGIAVGYKKAIVLGTLIAGAGLLMQVVSDVLSITLQAQLLLGRLTLVELGRRVLVLVLVGALALMGAHLLPFIAASTVAAAAAIVVMISVVRPYITIRVHFNRRIWRELFTDTLPYAVALSIGAIYFYVTVIIMSLAASSTQTGLFATSFRVTQVVLAIPSLLLTAVFPVLSRVQMERDDRFDQAVGRIFSVAVICGVWLSLATALGADFIIDVIAGRKGKGAVSVLQIQGLVFIVSFVYVANSLSLVAIRRYRPVIVGSSFALVLNIVLALILIPALGARGGAVADVVTETLAAIALTAMMTRIVPAHGVRGSLFASVTLASGLAAVVLLLPIGSPARVVGATIIYFATLLVTRTIPDEVIAAARRIGMSGARRAT
jgi:O-antigen/teichoic acid export membrane protein